MLKKQFGELIQIVKALDKPANISHARNIGAKQNGNSIIVFMDDDVIMGRNDNFARIIEILKYNDFCCGAERFWTTPEWYKYLSLDYQMNHNLQILKAKSFLPLSIERTTGKKNCSEFTYIGNFGAIKRSTFNTVNGFDELFEGWLYQDTDLLMRLCFNMYKYEILAYTDMFCYHLGHPADKEVYRRVNRELFKKKQNELNIIFHVNNFFGRFDDEVLSVIEYL